MCRHRVGSKKKKKCARSLFEQIFANKSNQRFNRLLNESFFRSFSFFFCYCYCQFHFVRMTKKKRVVLGQDMLFLF